MFLHVEKSAKTIVSNLDVDCIQPNAVDLRLNSMYQQLYNSHNFGQYQVEITEGGVAHGMYQPLMASEIKDRQGVTRFGYILEPKQHYQFDTHHEVQVAPNEVAWLIHRSSLARNGLIVTSGLYDAGFRGIVGGIIHNNNDYSVFVERGVRIAQLLIAVAESTKQYDGQYQDKGVITDGQ